MYTVHRVGECSRDLAHKSALYFLRGSVRSYPSKGSWCVTAEALAGGTERP